MIAPRSVLFAMIAVSGCGRLNYELAPERDSGSIDAGMFDGGMFDGGMSDGGMSDAGMIDAGMIDAGPIDDIAPRSDEFSGPPLGAQWTELEPARMGASPDDSGELVLTPLEVGQWFQNDRGGAVVTPITGDFIASAHISVFSPTGSTPFGPGVEMAGVIALDPASVDGARNHVLGAVGANSAEPAIDSKSTLNSESDYTISPYPESRAIVRVCRIGSEFRIYHRELASPPFVMHRTFDRPDLPAALDVGVFASENSDPPDIEVRIDWIRFRRPTSFDDCLID